MAIQFRNFPPLGWLSKFQSRHPDRRFVLPIYARTGHGARPYSSTQWESEEEDTGSYISGGRSAMSGNEDYDGGYMKKKEKQKGIGRGKWIRTPGNGIGPRKRKSGERSPDKERSQDREPGDRDGRERSKSGRDDEGEAESESQQSDSEQSESDQQEQERERERQREREKRDKARKDSAMAKQKEKESEKEKEKEKEREKEKRMAADSEKEEEKEKKKESEQKSSQSHSQTQSQQQNKQRQENENASEKERERMSEKPPAQQTQAQTQAQPQPQAQPKPQPPVQGRSSSQKDHEMGGDSESQQSIKKEKESDSAQESRAAQSKKRPISDDATAAQTQSQPPSQPMIDADDESVAPDAASDASKRENRKRPRVQPVKEEQESQDSKAAAGSDAEDAPTQKIRKESQSDVNRASRRESGSNRSSALSSTAPAAPSSSSATPLASSSRSQSQPVPSSRDAALRSARNSLGNPTNSNTAVSTPNSSNSNSSSWKYYAPMDSLYGKSTFESHPLVVYFQWRRIPPRSSLIFDHSADLQGDRPASQPMFKLDGLNSISGDPGLAYHQAVNFQFRRLTYNAAQHQQLVSSLSPFASGSASDLAPAAGKQQDWSDYYVKISDLVPYLKRCGIPLPKHTFVCGALWRNTAITLAAEQQDKEKEREKGSSSRNRVRESGAGPVKSPEAEPKFPPLPVDRVFRPLIDHAELLVIDTSHSQLAGHGAKEIFIQLDYPVEHNSPEYFQLFGMSPEAAASAGDSVNMAIPSSVLKVENFTDLQHRYEAVQCVVGSGTVSKGLFEMMASQIPLSWSTFINYHKTLSMVEAANIDPRDPELQRVTGPKIAREFVELKALERETHGKKRARGRSETEPTEK